MPSFTLKSKGACAPPEYMAPAPMRSSNKGAFNVNSLKVFSHVIIGRQWTQWHTSLMPFPAGALATDNKHVVLTCALKHVMSKCTWSRWPLNENLSQIPCDTFRRDMDSCFMAKFRENLRLESWRKNVTSEMSSHISDRRKKPGRARIVRAPYFARWGRSHLKFHERCCPYIILCTTAAFGPDWLVFAAELFPQDIFLDLKVIVWSLNGHRPPSWVVGRICRTTHEGLFIVAIPVKISSWSPY